MSIHDILAKIKGRAGIDHITLINIIVIVLVGICSFGLGRLSLGNTQIDEPITITGSLDKNSNQKIKTPDIDNNIKSINTLSKGQYVASKNGKLYYSIGCSGVNRIKEENKIWFETKDEAEKYGLTMSSTCK